MSSKYEAGKRLVWSLTVISLAAICLWIGADFNTASAKVTGKYQGSSKSSFGPGTVIPGTGVGAIPDGPGIPTVCGSPGPNLDISFDASGVSGTVSDISLDMNATHTWVGDLTATLIAPDATSHVIFGATGSTAAAGCGSADDLGAVYAFSDTGTADWWALGSPYPAGNYRTTELGGFTGSTGAATDFAAAFSGVSATGTWILRITDGGAGDTGAISAANLTLVTPSASDPSVDFDGDGKSDYSTVRDETPGGMLTMGPAGRRSIQELQNDPGFKPLEPMGQSVGTVNQGTNIGWYIHNSNNNTATVQGFGQPATDFWVPEDYDGDGRDDIAVWRGVSAAGPAGGFFYTLTSSNSTVNEIDFGQTGDNPTMVGDYDGDGSADPAVYRCPPGGGQCTFFYKGSAGGGEITYRDWGNNSSAAIRPYPGDFDGDGKNDFNIFQGGTYILNRSSDGGVEYVNWGSASDPVIVPGDYDGDGKTDFMNVIVSGNDIQWWLLERDGGTSTTVWGALVPGFSEFTSPGDFDGDGKTDIGIWRRDNSSTSNSFFYTLRSSDGMLEAFEWGSMGDAPVPGWNAN